MNIILRKSFFTAFTFVSIIFLSHTNAQTADTVKYTIDNCVNEFKAGKTVKTDAGYQYWFVDKKFADGKTLKMSVVAPGKATHVPHSHPEDEFFFILEGKAEFYLNGKTKIAGPYTSFYCPSNSMHGIRNAGDTELKYLVIKKYPVKTED